MLVLMIWLLSAWGFSLLVNAAFALGGVRWRWWLHGVEQYEGSVQARKEKQQASLLYAFIFWLQRCWARIFAFWCRNNIEMGLIMIVVSFWQHNMVHWRLETLYNLALLTVLHCISWKNWKTWLHSCHDIAGRAQDKCYKRDLTPLMGHSRNDAFEKREQYLLKHNMKCNRLRSPKGSWSYPWQLNMYDSYQLQYVAIAILPKTVNVEQAWTPLLLPICMQIFKPWQTGRQKNCKWPEGNPPPRNQLYKAVFRIGSAQRCTGK